MSDQITLTGFGEPYEKELATYNEIHPHLRSAVASMGADPDLISIEHRKDYSSILYGKTLSFRLRIRKLSHYIEVPIEAKEIVAALAPSSDQRRVENDYWRVKVSQALVVEHPDILVAVIKDTINRLPKEWDCCSRYMECSNAKKCVHPDPVLALYCGYRKVLASGRVFYGKNRNVD